MLANGPHVVTVFPEVESDDGYGTVLRVPDGTGVEVRGWMQPVRAEELAALGQQARTTYKLIAAAVPGGAWSKVLWEGREYEPVGEPVEHGVGMTLAHSTVLLAARAPRPL